MFTAAHPVRGVEVEKDLLNGKADGGPVKNLLDTVPLTAQLRRALGPGSGDFEGKHPQMRQF